MIPAQWIEQHSRQGLLSPDLLGNQLPLNIIRDRSSLISLDTALQPARCLVNPVIIGQGRIALSGGRRPRVRCTLRVGMSFSSGRLKAGRR